MCSSQTTKAYFYNAFHVGISSCDPGICVPSVYQMLYDHFIKEGMKAEFM